MKVESALRAAAVVIPELKPLLPDLLAAADAVAKARAAAEPAMARIEAGEPAFLEEAQAAAAIAPMLPDLVKGLKAFEAAAGIVEAWADRVAAAAK